jgi:asparagine N-glycosylation enzyme membrane subunit Stt3
MSRIVPLQARALQLGFLLPLELVLLLAMSLRCADLAGLRETYTLDNDSFRFLRIAEADVSGRPIAERDSMRWWPSGRDMTTHLSLHSLMISRLYRVAIHLGFRRPFRSFALRYPVVCFALCICVLYFIMSRHVSTLAGLIAAVGLAVTPSTVYRSSAGFVDRDPTCMLLILCAYAAYAQMLLDRRPKAGLGAAVLCAGFSATLGLAWEGVGLFTVAFAVTLAWMAMADRLTAEQLIRHLIWCVIAIPPLLVFTHSYRLLYQPYAALALFPVPIVCLMALVLTWARDLSRQRLAMSHTRLSSSRLFVGLIVLAILLGASTLVLFGHFGRAISGLLDNAISTFGPSALYRWKNELSHVYWGDWSTHYGASLILFVTGLGVVAAEVGGRGTRRGHLLGGLALLCSVVVLASNDLPGLFLPTSGEPKASFDTDLLAGVSRLSMLPLWFLGTVVLAATQKCEAKQAKLAQSPLFFFMSLWWFLMVTATAGAVRNAFFLAPAGWAVAGYGLSRFCGRQGAHDSAETSGTRLGYLLAMVILTEWCLWIAGFGPIHAWFDRWANPTLEAGILTSASLVALFVLLRSDASGGGIEIWPLGVPARRVASLALLGVCLASNTVHAKVEAAATSPGHRWLYPFLEQMDRRLPGKAVVLSWADFGSDINVLARRTTVIDEDDYFGQARIAEVAQRAYCAQNPARAADFLVGDRITHWLITDFDLHVMPAIASIAGLALSSTEMRVFDFFQVHQAKGLSPDVTDLFPDAPQHSPQRLLDRLTLTGLGSLDAPVCISTVRLR